MFMAANLSMALHSLLFECLSGPAKWFLKLVHKLINFKFGLINWFGIPFCFNLEIHRIKELLDAPDWVVQVLLKLISIIPLLRLNLVEISDWKHFICRANRSKIVIVPVKDGIWGHPRPQDCARTCRLIEGVQLRFPLENRVLWLSLENLFILSLQVVSHISSSLLSMLLNHYPWVRVQKLL